MSFFLLILYFFEVLLHRLYVTSKVVRWVKQIGHRERYNSFAKATCLQWAEDDGHYYIRPFITAHITDCIKNYYR